MPVFPTTGIPSPLMQSSTISYERPNQPIIAQTIQNPILSKNEIPIPGCNCPKCTRLRNEQNFKEIRIISPNMTNITISPTIGCNCPTCSKIRNFS